MKKEMETDNMVKILIVIVVILTGGVGLIRWFYFRRISN